MIMSETISDSQIETIIISSKDFGILEKKANFYQNISEGRETVLVPISKLDPFNKVTEYEVKFKYDRFTGYFVLDDHRVQIVDSIKK